VSIEGANLPARRLAPSGADCFRAVMGRPRPRADDARKPRGPAGHHAEAREPIHDPTFRSHSSPLESAISLFPPRPPGDCQLCLV